jgi:hypothetical protein
MRDVAQRLEGAEGCAPNVMAKGGVRFTADSSVLTAKIVK